MPPPAGAPLPDDIAVTYPAHWESAAVEALGAALGEIPEWSRRARPIVLIPDAAAALLAVRTSLACRRAEPWPSAISAAAAPASR